MESVKFTKQRKKHMERGFSSKRRVRKKSLPLTNIGYCPADSTAGNAMAVVFVEPASYIKNKRKHANQLVSFISKNLRSTLERLTLIRLWINKFHLLPVIKYLFFYYYYHFINKFFLFFFSLSLFFHFFFFLFFFTIIFLNVSLCLIQTKYFSWHYIYYKNYIHMEKD